MFQVIPSKSLKPMGKAFASWDFCKLDAFMITNTNEEQ